MRRDRAAARERALTALGLAVGLLAAAVLAQTADRWRPAAPAAAVSASSQAPGAAPRPLPQLSGADAIDYARAFESLDKSDREVAVQRANFRGFRVGWAEAVALRPQRYHLSDNPLDQPARPFHDDRDRRWPSTQKPRRKLSRATYHAVLRDRSHELVEGPRFGAHVKRKLEVVFPLVPRGMLGASHWDPLLAHLEQWRRREARRATLTLQQSRREPVPRRGQLWFAIFVAAQDDVDLSRSTHRLGVSVRLYPLRPMSQLEAVPISDWHHRVGHRSPREQLDTKVTLGSAPLRKGRWMTPFGELELADQATRAAVRGAGNARVALRILPGGHLFRSYTLGESLEILDGARQE